MNMDAYDLGVPLCRVTPSTCVHLTSMARRFFSLKRSFDRFDGNAPRRPLKGPQRPPLSDMDLQSREERHLGAVLLRADGTDALSARTPKTPVGGYDVNPGGLSPLHAHYKAQMAQNPGVAVPMSAMTGFAITRERLDQKTTSTIPQLREGALRVRVAERRSTTRPGACRRGSSCCTPVCQRFTVVVVRLSTSAAAPGMSRRRSASA